MNWSTLRIAIVGPLPPPAGGMAGQTQQLAELLRGEGADVRLVQTNPPYRPAWIAKYRGVRAMARLVGYVARLWFAAGEVRIFHVMANSGWSWHLFAAPAIWIGRLRGVRVLVNYRGGEARSFLERSARWVRPSLNAASGLMVPSGFLEEVFAAFGFRAHVVPNVVDLSRFRPSRDGETLGGGAPVIMVARNLEPIYDNATALRAFALVLRQIPAARLVIAGSGPDEPMLKTLAAQMDISTRVDFTGRLNREQMADQYRAASVMLNPSRVDNTPNSVLEALASGVPVVSTDVGGVPFIVNHGRTALLVPPGDAEQMAQALVRVAAEPGLAATLRAAGLRDVQAYSWPRVKKMLGSLYQSLLETDVPHEHPV